MEAAEEAEVDKGAFVVPKEDESSKAASDPGPSTNQTRFSFYNADEVNEALSPSGSEEEPKRFHFYNADEVNEKSKDIVATRNKRLDFLKSKKASPLRGRLVANSTDKDIASTRNKNFKVNFLKKTSISSKTPTPKSDVGNVGVADSKQPQSTVLSDSNEILRSLQEIERERDQRRINRGSQNVATPRLSNTNGGYEGYPHRDDKSSRREDGVTEAKLRKRIEISENLKGNSGGRGVVNRNPYEIAIKEALLLLRQQYSKPQPQDSTRGAMAGCTVTGPGDDQVMLTRTPDRISQCRSSETSDHSDEDSIDADAILSEPSPDLDGLSSFESMREADDPSISELRSGSSSLPGAEMSEQESNARQDRIAKYASKLAELQPPPAPLVVTATAKESDLLSPPQDLQKRNIQSETLFREGSAKEGVPEIQPGVPFAASGGPICSSEQKSTPNRVRPRSDSGADFSLGTFSSREEDVQKGVERVLLAILERANSTDATDYRPHMGVDLLLQTRSSWDSEEGQDRNSLARAVDSLLRPNHSYSVDSSHDERFSRPSRRESLEREDDESALSATDAAERDAKNTSVVEELLAEEETLAEAELETFEEGPQHANASSGAKVQSEKRVKEATNRGTQLSKMTAGEPSSPEASFMTPSSTEVEQALSPQSTLSKSDVGTTVSPSDSYDNVEDARSRSDLDIDDDDDDELENETQADSLLGNDSLSRVLGPLSKKAGGTTGVVLEASDTPPAQRLGQPSAAAEGGDHSSELHMSPPAPLFSDSKENPSSPTILESLSVNAESFMSFMSSALAAESPHDKYEGQDKYAAADEGETVDEEARELMRTLCAHLLPFGVDTSAKIQSLENVPAWDNSNPNEAGYRIIRLTKSQLRRVEREFQQMVNSVREKSERGLSGMNGSNMQYESAKDDLLENGEEVDQGFERDLEEAEKLLDREEKRYNAVKAVEKANETVKLELPQTDVESNGSRSSSSEDDSSSDSESDEERSASATSSEGEPTVACHPDFPGVRPPGKGEMGDLEYFHLPIIYKSHVTGFEPTKDLYLEPGNVVAGQYLVENELGSAAFSTAYRCIDLNSDTTSDSGVAHDEVCLKVIKNTKDFFDQSLDEIKILELLRKTGQCHENHIVEMKTFFYHREHLIIVTELLRQNLFEFGKFIIDNDEEAYFTLPRLCYITRQVLIALRFVHKLGLVHSDVKPENILLSSYSRAKVKLIDFGSSCYLTDRQSSYIQSRSYRAPEVVLGLPYDGKIDIWSLGCVVAEMFTGEVTFQNDSIVSMLSRIEAICGAFPRHMIAQGRQSGRFFTSSGLLYEQVDGNEEEKKDPSGLLNFEDDDDDGRARESQPLFDVFQPKTTNLAERLGFDPNLMELRKGTAEEQDQAMFVDFIRGLLTIDPDSRFSAEEALQHPWIVLGEELTEEDIKYPSS